MCAWGWPALSLQQKQGWEQDLRAQVSGSCLFSLSLALLGEEGLGCSPLGNPGAASPLQWPSPG